MSESHSSLFHFVQDGLDHDRHAALAWEGSFQEYLALAEDKPAVARNSWQRLLDMIEHHGYEDPHGRSGHRRWSIFDDPFDRGTPRTSMAGFLDATHEGDFERASEYLDLRHLRAKKKKTISGAELARQLGTVFDQALWVDLDSLSASAKG